MLPPPPPGHRSLPLPLAPPRSATPACSVVRRAPRSAAADGHQRDLLLLQQLLRGDNRQPSRGHQLGRGDQCGGHLRGAAADGQDWEGAPYPMECGGDACIYCGGDAVAAGVPTEPGGCVWRDGLRDLL